MDLVLCSLCGHRFLLLHSFLCGQLPRYGDCLRELPDCEVEDLG